MYYYFFINIKNRTVSFIFEDSNRSEKFLSMTGNTVIKFDDIFPLAEEMSNLSSGNDQANNIFAQIFYSKLSGSKSIGDVKECFNKLVFYIENDFDIDITPCLLTDNNIVTYKEGNPKLFINMNNGFETFVYCFAWTIKNSNLHAFRCAHCGRFYFNTSNRIYCFSPECQHIKLLEYNKQVRKKRRKDIYTKMIDSYHAYTRQIRRILKLMRVDEDELQYFESENQKCDRIVISLINKYRKEQKPVDDKLIKVIHGNRVNLSNIKDKLWKKYFKNDIE